ncbi:hypothetical protein HZI73_26040 (plasmid) [Vallitalea pronyensis]|uniref:Helix-turn-helix domain-containing protein n=1 Tax=Vallitalea pronyensis TaxID=1348613 RepID=A0A8J8MQF7_9FIRM|nr:helix-turn-helix domain-containing protein [Vallitalea pronyensis]QUI25952.1 hypothetical protein HZI73_26040 [Vallitalea pronyensis]
MLDKILTATYASEIWGLDNSTIRSACLKGYYDMDQAYQMGKVWFVTESSVIDKYGDYQDIINKIISKKHKNPVLALLYMIKTGKYLITDILNMDMDQSTKKGVLEELHLELSSDIRKDLIISLETGIRLKMEAKPQYKHYEYTIGGYPEDVANEVLKMLGKEFRIRKLKYHRILITRLK